MRGWSIMGAFARACILGSVATAFGCVANVDDGEQTLGESRDELYWDISRGANAAHWPRQANHFGSGLGADINVCYRFHNSIVAGSADATTATSLVSKMRRWVDNSWSRVADVNTYNWGQCGANTTGWLVVEINKGAGSRSGLGYKGSGSNTVLQMDINEGRQPVTTLHEFGHALGFLHEFMRADWPQTAPTAGMVCSKDSDCTAPGDYGPTCMKPAGSASGYCRAPNAGSTLSPTYDFESVMAATYVGNTVNADQDGVADPLGSLSAWDILGAQSKYGPKHTGSIVGLGGRCANIAGGLANNNQPLVAWDCFNADNDTYTPFANQTNPPRKTIPARTGARCWNVLGGVVSPNAGTAVTSWSCIESAANEQFDFTGMHIRAMGNMCLTASSTASGAQIESHKCSALLNARQRWDIVGNTIRLASTNLCASVPAGATAAGTPVSLRSCVNDSGQTLSLANGKVQVGTRCWDVLGGTTLEGSVLGIWDGCGGEFPNERFHATGTIKSLGQCLDMFGGVSSTGATIGVYPCAAGAPNEEWDVNW